MKQYGSWSELVSIVFREDTFAVTFRPNQSTTYTAARDIQLPPGDANHVIVSQDSTQTLTNKTIDADSNTITNIENADIKSAANIAVNKLAATTASRALASDGSGFLTASATTATELGRLSGITSTAVGISDTQTLTNKTINGANNTITNVSLTTGVTGSLPIANGGTGQTTANAALNALLPSQTSEAGKVLTTNGTNAAWAAGLTTTLNSARIFVGNGSNVATAVDVTGDVTISNTGVTTVVAATGSSAGLIPKFSQSGNLTLPTVVFDGTAPTTLAGSSYSWSRMGQLVTVTWRANWTNPGINNQLVYWVLPGTMPAPRAPGGGVNGEAWYVGTGGLGNTAGSTPVANSTFLWRTAGGENWMYNIAYAPLGVRFIYGSLSYYTDA